LANQLNELGRILLNLREDQQAKETLQQALEVLEQSDETDLIAIGTLLCQLGLALHHLGDLEEATDKFQWAAATLDVADPSTREHLLVVSTNLYRLGVVLAEGKRIDEAERTFEQTLSLEQRLYDEDDPNTVMTLNLLGAIQYRQGKAATARTTLMRALSAMNGWALTYPFEFALALASLATVRRATSSSREGDHLAERALGVAASFSNTPEEEVFGLNLVGCRIIHTTGDLRQAIDFFEHAQEKLTLIGDTHVPLWNRTFGNLSWVMSALHETRRPRAWFTDEYGAPAFQARIGSNVVTILDPSTIRDPGHPPGAKLSGWWGS